MTRMCCYFKANGPFPCRFLSFPQDETLCYDSYQSLKSKDCVARHFLLWSDHLVLSSGT